MILHFSSLNEVEYPEVESQEQIRGWWAAFQTEFRWLLKNVEGMRWIIVQTVEIKGLSTLGLENNYAVLAAVRHGDMWRLVKFSPATESFFRAAMFKEGCRAGIWYWVGIMEELFKKGE